MDSSKAKRRAPHLPQAVDGRARHRKKNRSGFSQNFRKSAQVFASLARLVRWRRTVVAGQAMQKSHDGSFY
jgi:hypothetical protein